MLAVSTRFTDSRPIPAARRSIDPEASRRARDSRLDEQRRAVEELMERGRRAARAYQRREFDSNATISLRTIMRRICRATGVTREELSSLTRKERNVLARQAISYWACRLTPMSMPEIGQAMGRNFTTIMHGRDAYPAKRAKMGRRVRALK